MAKLRLANRMLIHFKLDYQGAWPPQLYIIVFLTFKNVLNDKILALKHTIISLLNQRNISAKKNDVKLANELAIEFVQEFAKLYYERLNRINVHYLLHLPDVVHQVWPSLHQSSAFMLENCIWLPLATLIKKTCI